MQSAMEVINLPQLKATGGRVPTVNKFFLATNHQHALAQPKKILTQKDSATKAIEVFYAPNARLDMSEILIFSALNAHNSGKISLF